MIRTESGGRVPASYRSGRYDEWRKRNEPAQQDDPADDASPNKPRENSLLIYFFHALSCIPHMAR